MTKPILRLPGALMLLALAACTPADKTPRTAPGATTASDQRAASAVGTALVTAAARPSPAARTAAEFDTTTREQRAAAAAPPTTGERRLGTTIASLGDPSQPGFWIKTPLAKSETDGRIVNPANGKSAKVRLIPLDGPASGGSQVSLPALQLIGVSLTDLPTIEVYGS
ncbi:hypothetical protein [Paracoccus denitrificans]|uniref:hypothetical protein n=1 Tax=Paracoccus denitrificans TaxID=266 RepID=UPI000CEC0237|nr:hypothetical protein [Paracoccus denitrificans]